MALFADMKISLRMLRKSPGFTAVAVATLAIGIGANTAIFSTVNSILLHPLSYPEPQRLYVVAEVIPQWAKSYPLLAANVPNFQIWQKECRSFEQVAIAESLSMYLSGTGPTEKLQGARASSNLLSVLGAHSMMGRLFRAEEDETGKDSVVIITDSFWRSHFHSDPAVVGSTLVLDGAPHTVVGILPASFHFPKELASVASFGDHIDFFKPLGGVRDYERSLIGEFDFAAIARLKPGVTREQALAELNLIQADIARQARTTLDLKAELIPLEAEVIGPARRGLVLLLAAVGAVLLIICVNLTNLLLARIPGRMRDAAIRAALGATRAQIVRQMIMESLILALAGGALGAWLGTLGLRWLVHAAPANIPRLDEVAMDARAFGFVALVSALAGIIMGLLPAWRLTYAHPQDILKSQSTTATEGSRTRHLREILVAVEVGLCTLLLIVAGLLGVSLFRVVTLDPGFTMDHVITAGVDLPQKSYSQPAVRDNFYTQVLSGLRALPGVHSAAWITILPLNGQGSVSGMSLPDKPLPPEQRPIVNYRVVSPGYFETVGIPLVAGRTFSEADRGHREIIISRSLAEKLWPGENPVGRICMGEWGLLGESRVIGIVGDVRTQLERPPRFMAYVPDSYAMNPPSLPNYASFVVRAGGDPGALLQPVRKVINNVAPDVPVVGLQPMSALISKSTQGRRFQISLAGIFALSALLLAALGIFGVVAYSVEQRRQELGIRLALGAESRTIFKLVLRQGMLPVAAGVCLGIAAALLTGKLVQNLLYGVSAFDPWIMASVVVVVSLMALLACHVPARKATRVDPMTSLRVI